MEQFSMRSPQMVGLACAAAAVGLGAAYLAAAQAPSAYILVNGAAFVAGLIACAALMRWGGAGTSRSGAVILALAVLILATALFGGSAEGLTRWIWIGSFGVQVSLLFLPAMILIYARRPDAIRTAGLVLAALGLALQPDRAMAGVLAASLLTLAILRFKPGVGIALAAAVIGFVVTLLRPDTAAASPWVDRILYTAFELHPLAGAAVLTGTLLLIVPAIYGVRVSPAHRHAYAVFGTVWIGVVVAAAIGNYPTPLVGYGGSAVLGYLLSLAAAAPAAPRRSGGKAPRGQKRTGLGRAPRSLRAA